MSKPIKALVQARHLQEVAHELGLKLKIDVQTAQDADSRMRIARALKDVVQAWDTARDACRVLRGKGLPRMVAVAPTTRRRKATAFEPQITDGQPPAETDERNGQTRMPAPDPGPATDDDKGISFGRANRGDG